MADVCLVPQVYNAERYASSHFINTAALTPNTYSGITTNIKTFCPRYIACLTLSLFFVVYMKFALNTRDPAEPEKLCMTPVCL